MTYTEFRAQAILSAELYFNYLEREGKGRVSNSIRSFSVLDRSLVKLMLSGRLGSTDDIQIKVLNRIYSADEILPIRYDKEDRSLLVRPRAELLSVFWDCSPSEITVISDLKFLVRRVGQWYESHTAPFSLPATVPASPPALPPLALVPSEEQKKAFAGVFRNPISYIWGAPGTGKTQFVLARAVLAYCLQGKKVLITAPTNNAVEQTLKGVLSVLEEAGIPLEKVLRLGIPSSEFFERYPMVCEIQSVERQLSHIEQELSFSQKALAFFASREWYDEASPALSEARARVVEIRSAEFEQQEKMKKVHVLLLEKNALSAPILSQLERKTAERDRLLSFLNQKRTRLSAWLSRRKLAHTNDALTRLDLELSDLGKEHHALHTEISELNHQQELIRREQEQLKTDLAAVISSLKQLPPCPVKGGFDLSLLGNLSSETFDAKIDCISSELSRFGNYLQEREPLYASFSPQELQERIETLEHKKSTISTQSVAARLPDCLVVAATLDGFISKLSDNDAFHPSHVFLDEAAYCPIIKCFTLLSAAAPLTMLGDHRQLPPVCEASISYMKAEGHEPFCLWAQSALYLEDVFHASMSELAARFFCSKPPSFRQIAKYDLLQTFRFGESLAVVLDRFVYQSGFQGNPEIGTALYFVSASRQSPPRKGKHQNYEECNAIQHLTEHSKLGSYAVLTPYRGQRELLAKHLLEPDLVFTIHGSQGREWDTVILSVVETTQSWFLTPLLINTAVSRARKQLIIVCDAEYWIQCKSHIIGGLLSAACPYEM